MFENSYQNTRVCISSSGSQQLGCVKCTGRSHAGCAHEPQDTSNARQTRMADLAADMQFAAVVGLYTVTM